MSIRLSLVWRQAARVRPLQHAVKLPFRAPCLSSAAHLFTQSHSLLRRWRKKPSFTPSQEQMEIVRLCCDQNVIVSARPGSGKTATAEAIVAAHPDKRIAVLTHSKGLQVETNRRLHHYSNCKNLTLHAMAGLLLRATVRNDADLLEQRRRVLHCNLPLQWIYEPFDIIVLDEFQDCTEALFWLVNCFILANKYKKGGQSPRLVVLGDERQFIHRYRHADHRYLSLAPELFAPVSPYPFSRIPLSESFRLSDPSVRFVNDVFLGGEEYMKSSKPGPKPIFLSCNPFDNHMLAKKLSTMIEHHGAMNSVIIAPSPLKNEPVRRLTNTLCEEYNVPMAVSINYETPVDERVMKGKMCASTIHRFKGSERDLVILFGIDSSFFKYFGRHLPDDRCPNEIFVALTRAAKQLVLVHDETKKLMPFMSVRALYERAEVVDMTNKPAKVVVPDAPSRLLELGLHLPPSISVRDMARHMRDEELHEIITQNLCIQKTPPLAEEEHIDIPGIVLSDPKKLFHEAVSDINGLVVAAAFEHSVAGTLRTLGLDQSMTNAASTVSSQRYVSWLCQQACDYEARLSGYRHRKLQMKKHKFDWMRSSQVALARHRLQEELGSSATKLKFEVNVEHEFNIGDKRTRLHGQADVITSSSTSGLNSSRNSECLWEIKFVSQLSNEHVVQACTYAYLWALQSEELPHIVLYNVRDGEKWEIIPNGGQEGLRRMIESVLVGKYTTVGDIEDKDFVKMCSRATLEALNCGNSQP